MGKVTAKNRRGKGRKLLCLLLAFAILIPMLPVMAEAAELTDRLVLQITTGESAGEEVTFIALEYRDTSGYLHKEYIFPHLDGLNNTFQRYQALNTVDETRRIESKAMGLTADWSYRSQKALQPYSTDTFVFDLSFEVDLEQSNWFESIEIYCEGAQENGGNFNWDVQGMRLYSGDQVRMLLSGGAKGEYRLVPYGTKLADMAVSGKSLSWTNDTLFTFGVGAEADVKMNLSRSGVAWDGANDYYTFRVDFADVYGAGIEALAQDYNGQKSLKDQQGSEALVMEVQYQDVWGDVIRVNIPVINSVLLSLNAEAAMENTAITKVFKDLKLLGWAQQGESVAFTACLPNMAKVTRVTFFSGNEVTARTGLPVLQEESISITNVSVYEGRLDGTLTPDSASAVLLMDSDGNDLNEAFVFRNTPIFYHTASSYTGETVARDGNLIINLSEYTSGAKLTPVNTNERYLVELKADGTSIYEVPDDIYIKFKYRTVKGELRETSRISVRSAVSDFYGYWPASEEDFAYKVLMYQEGVGGEYGGVKFIVEMRDVEYFSGVVIDTGDSGSDWQLSGLQISTLDHMDIREGQWKPISLNGISSDREYSRRTYGNLVFTLNETVLVQPGESEEMDFTSGSVVSGDEVNWEDIKYAMTFDESCANLGFTKSRETYTVEVQVAGDTVSLDNNGDNGSKNKFFFRLVFENGSSGYVLANQQLGADGFRSGYNETFTVTTNRNYGELVSVQIIPDDTSEESDIFDKLNVERIKVRHNTTDSVSRQWTVSEVGWIDIDYRDEGAGSSITGQPGRTESEISHVYPVTYRSYGVNLLFNINTGSYESSNQNANTEQFYGTVNGVLWYTNSIGEVVSYSFDLVEEMYKYANRDPIYDVDESGRKTTAVNNRDYMFRANHTDRFFLSLDDIVRVNRLDLNVTSLTGGSWTINNVAIQQVLSDGVLKISDEDEYVRTNETKPLCANINEDGTEVVKLNLPTNERQTYTIYFPDNKIEVDKENFTWVSTVSREPQSKNDEINVYIYPTTYVDADYDINTSLMYTDAFGERWRTGAKDLSRYTVDGQQVFSVQGISASGMSSLNSLSIEAETGRDVADVHISHAVVQQVRAGVVINSYYVDCMNQNAAWSFTVRPGELSGVTKTEQVVTLALTEGTEMANLLAEKRDLAVALRYTSSNEATGREYQSRYIFLTDVGYDTLEAGDVLSLTFNEEYVQEITGVVLVSSGGLKLTVDCAGVGVYTVSENAATGEVKRTLQAWNSFANGVVLNNNSATLKATKTTMVNPLELQFQVAPAGTTLESGTDAAIAMTLGYTSADGSSRTAYFKDIRPYVISEGRAFATGSLTTVKMLLKDAAEVRWIMLEPYDSFDAHATLKLTAITALLGDNGSIQTANRAVADTVIFEEGAPQQINLSNITVECTVSYGGHNYSVRSTGNALKLLAESGAGVDIKNIYVNGSVSGGTVTAERISADGSVSAADGVLTKNGTAGWTFRTDNTGSSSVFYRITVASGEVPGIAAVVEIEVSPAPVVPDTEQGESGSQGTGNSGTESDGTN